MGFYGLLLLGTVIATMAIVHQGLLSAQNSLSGSVATISYSNLQLVGAFTAAAEDSRTTANALDTQDWRNAVEISARVDGFNVSEPGNVLIISTPTFPKEYSVIGTGMPND
jgi:hypothetical protein